MSAGGCADEGSEGNRRGPGCPSSPLVSVVIPTRNRQRYLVRTLGAVLAQQQVDFEVVVVDDASEDGTETYLRELQDCRVRTVRHERPLGVAAARNYGVAVAVGQWVAFTDDDDLWSPGKLAAQLRSLESVAGAEWSCVGAVVVSDALRLIRVNMPPSGADVADLLLDRNVIPGGASGVMARRDLILSSGGFDVQLSNLADWDCWIRLSLASPIAAVHQPLVAYLVHSGSLSHNVSATEEELVYILRKYADERILRGIELSGLVRAQYFAEMHQRAGRRMSAVRAHVHVARQYRRRRSWIMALLAAVWPRTQAIRDYGSRLLIPAEHKEFVESWLGSIRAES